ncbi:MFS AGZA family xanthine/uracil permease [Phlyctema vagabunda]|uniref:MFS AGZA family xanthine/uracil permease n=1 Tax=Phlyctema vagabunda TaxID=108571 RepID=A0ABR4P5J3_9HELO
MAISLQPVRDAIANFDYNISRSTFGRIFRLHGCGHEKARKNALFFTEIRAGITTFCTMAYIISVNASIIKDSGGVCECTSTTDPTCLTDAAYGACLLDLNRDLVTATAAITGIGSIMFGLFTNLPVALAPGMGMNAYFTYQVVGFHGTGPVSYRHALTAVFIEGIVFFLLSIIGMRQWLVKLIPASMKVASGAGIGLFLTVVGLSRSAGIGIINAGGSSAPIALGGCQDEFFNLETGVCDSHKMQNPQMWIGIMLGGILTGYLMAFRFKLAIIIGIAVVSIISWPRNSSFTYFPHSDDGDAKFDFFKKIITFHPISGILAAQDWNITNAGSQFALALFTLLYVDVIDTTATLYSMARFSGVVDPETGDFPRSTVAYCSDAFIISVGSLFGLSPVSAFVESGAGISEGGKTGLTAITTGVCFLLSIFLAPIFASIPPWATGCTLVLVGCMMMRQVTAVNWSYIGDALPAFVCIAFMPLSYSVAYGLIAGLFTYTAINGLIYLTKLASGGRWLPPDFDNAEYWTFSPKGRLPWFMRAARNGGKFWEHEKPTEEEIKDYEDADDRANDHDHRRSDTTSSEAHLKDHAVGPAARKSDMTISLHNM